MHHVKERKIYQSCHILHKQGKYYIVHFKELFALDGKKTNLSQNDVQRRNRIVQLLVDWGLVSICALSQEKIADLAPLNQIKVLSFKEKGEWTLESKYNIGRKKQESRINRKNYEGLTHPHFLCYPIKYYCDALWVTCKRRF